MKISRVDSFAIRMEKGTHGNVRGGTQPQVDNLGDHVIAKNAWTAIYSQHHETTIVRVESDSGVVGWGEAQSPVSPRTTRTIVEDLCRPVVLGCDPMDVEYLWYRQYSAMRERGHITGFYIDALAGVDIAIYDLLGKALNQPVYRLLGGRYRDTVKTYVGISGGTPEKVAESAAEHVGYGYRALKMHLRVPNRELVEMVRAVRSAVGDEIELMVDVHTTRDISAAVELGRELQTLGVRWLESPTAPEDVAGQAEIARSLDMQVATGEWLRTAWEWRQFIENRAVDAAMPDIARTGLSEGKRIAGLCDIYNIPVTPHVGGGGILSVAASVQFSAAIPNFQILEHSHKAHEVKGAIATEFPRTVDGEFIMDEKPGLGVEIDEAVVEKFAV